MKRTLLIALTALLLGVTVRAAEPSDSLARALATFWGSAVRTDRMTPAQHEAFIRGFEEAFAVNDSVTGPYVEGSRMASYIKQALNESGSMGLSVDSRAVGDNFVKVLRGENLGFTQASAQAYIDHAVAPEGGSSITPESQKEFVDSVAQAPGAITTPTGLVFQVITEGEGPMPTDGQTVSVMYTGSLSDGTVFDSTEQPIDLPVSRLVPGFTEGLKMMKPGGKYRLTIPAALGYGDTGAGGGIIPPGAALQFDVQLIEIKN